MQVYGNFAGFALENALIALFGLVSYNDPCNRFENLSDLCREADLDAYNHHDVTSFKLSKSIQRDFRDRKMCKLSQLPGECR